MSRKTYVIALTVLTIALAIIPNAYAKYAIDNYVIEKDLPDTLVAGSTYDMIATFDILSETYLAFKFNVICEDAPINKDEIIVESIFLNDYKFDWAEVEAGVFQTNEMKFGTKRDNELKITFSTIVNLIPGSYDFETELWAEDFPTPNKKPVADAGPDQTVYVGETVDFSGAKSYDPDGRIIRYDWDFGDGNTASGVEVSHSYLVPSSYTVTLTVKDNKLAKDTDTCLVTVTEAPPDMGTLSVETEPVSGEVFVEGESWGDAPQFREVDVGTYTVSFGDVEGYTTPASQEAVVTVDATIEIEGIYVEITVDTGTLSITTTPVDGEVFVEGDSWGTAPQEQVVAVGTYTVTFGEVSGYVTPDTVEVKVKVDETTDVLGTYDMIPPDMGVLSVDTEPVKGEVFVDGISWGTAPQSRVVAVGAHTVSYGAMSGYTIPANQVATVTADTTTKITGTYETPTEPGPAPSGGGSPNKKPVADAGPDQTAYVDEPVNFDGSGSDDPDGSIMSWSWSFGDGEKASGETASHTYSEPGVYTVTLTVKDNRNAEVSDTCIVTVTEETEPEPPIVPPLPPILSDLIITPEEIELGEEVTISLLVENIDSQSITYIVTMRIGELTLLVDVDLEPYEAETVSQTLTPEAEGTYEVTVDGMTGSFTVIVTPPPPPPRPAEFVVSDLTVSLDEVSVGDPVTVSVTVTNIGEEEGECIVVLKTTLGADSWEVTNYHTVDGGESETSEFTLTPNVDGIYTVEINGLLGSFTVTAPPGFLSPGYVAGILILIIAAGAAVYMLYRGGRIHLPKSTPGP